MLCQIVETKSYGGEGGIRTPGRSFGPYNGLAISRFHSLVFGRKDLVRVICPTLVQRSPVWRPLCNYCATRAF
jgi:hypothetical protein